MEIKEKDLNALYMALWAVKFPVNDEKLALLSGSSIIVAMLDDVMKQLNINDRLNIETVPDALEHVKRCVSNIHNFSDIPIEIRTLTLKNMLFPFDYSEELLEELVG